MINECRNCGAPLEVSSGMPVVRCSYCGIESRVRSMRTLYAERPADWRPPPTWAAPVRPAPPARGCATFAGLAVALLGVLFVGVVTTTSEDGCGADVLGLGGLDTEAPPILATLDPGVAPEAYVEGVSSGSLAANGVDAQCRGFVPRAPHAIVHASAPATVRLWTVSQSDVTLLVRRADGTIVCDDDSGENRNAQLELELPPGDHRVWVGAYHDNEEPRFGLHMSTLLVGAVRGVDGLAADAPPTLGTALVNEAGVSHQRYTGRVSGIVPARMTSSQCAGYLPLAPQLTLQVAAPHSVRLTTDGAADLVMYVRLPDGTARCDDDSGLDLNPMIAADLPVGVTKVWVGTLHEGEDAPLELWVTN